MLGEEVGEAPSGGRHDAKLAPSREIGPVCEDDLCVLGENFFWNFALVGAIGHLKCIIARYFGLGLALDPFAVQIDVEAFDLDFT